MPASMLSHVPRVYWLRSTPEGVVVAVAVIVIVIVIVAVIVIGR